MAAIHDTAYPRLASSLSSAELKRLYSITRKEKTWIEKQRITQTSLLDTVVYLKVFQCLGTSLPQLPYLPRLFSLLPANVTSIRTTPSIPLNGCRIASNNMSVISARSNPSLPRSMKNGFMISPARWLPPKIIRLTSSTR